MSQVDVAASVSVKEAQSDATPTGEVSVSFSDAKVDDYNGPIKLKIAPTAIKTIDVTHLTSLRLIIIKRIAGSTFKLALRRSSADSTDLEIRRFFAAEMSNVEQVKLTNNGDEDLEVQVELVSIRDQ